jgi:hypothetical protein
VLGLSLWAETRTAVELGPGELVIANAYRRRRIPATEIRRIEVTGIGSGMPDLMKSGVAVILQNGRTVDLQSSLGITPSQRLQLRDALRSWGRANKVATEIDTVGGRHRWQVTLRVRPR